jgi:hypothetical protein
MRKLIVLSFIAILLSNTAQAQIEYIFAAGDDAATYTKQYLNPAINGIMYDLNSGWFSRAKTHKKFGFDLTFTTSFAIIPDDEKQFQFVAADYTNLTLQGGNTTLPTIAGTKTNAVLETHILGNTFTIDALDGYSDHWLKEFFIPLSIPTPMIQAGLGLPFKTDIKLRFFPNTEREGIAFNLFGLGVKHNLSQYFIKTAGIFTVSGMAAFTNINFSYVPNNTDIPGDNQEISMKLKTYTAQIIAGVNLKIVNVYAAYGYNSGKTDLGVKGNYDFDFNYDGSIDPATERVVDPVNLNFAISGYKTTLGVRLNLGPAKIFADYTLQKYPSVTAGIAVSVR